MRSDSSVSPTMTNFDLVREAYQKYKNFFVKNRISSMTRLEIIAAHRELNVLVDMINEDQSLSIALGAEVQHLKRVKVTLKGSLVRSAA